MDRKRLLKNPLLWIVAVLLLYFAFSMLFDGDRGYTAVPTSQAVQQIESGNVTEANLEDKEQQLKLHLSEGINVDGENAKQIITKFPGGASGQLYNVLLDARTGSGDNGQSIKFDTTVTQDSFFTQMLIYMIPLGILLLLLMWMMNNAQGGGNKVLNFGKSKAKQLNKDMPTTTFHDVAGADEAVEELHEIKDFLSSPGRYQQLGAKIPKGVLLYGPPGTGKTLLARAVAGEAGVPFYTISGSDFVEMFVGVGASRVRDLFEQAKQNAPCIIFVDEIDAVGRQRGAGMGGGHDEREQTLNQLLVEMDGFDSRGGIILIAATNRPDILDPALLRPGRFDRQIPVAAPDLRGREAILQVHSAGKPLAENVDMNGLAKRTVGMSGADLANVINEAALLTARQHGTVITDAYLEESVDRVVGGPARKSRIISEQERKITAYHEGGHALAAWAMPDIEPVYKLTILPRGRTGGHALIVPEDDKDLMTRSEMIGRLVFAMGGRTAEELVFHEPTTGASSDIEQATKIARAMVTEYGMSPRLGAVKYGQEQGDPFVGRAAGQQANYSLEVAHEIDEEVRKLIETAHTEAWEVLNTYRDVLDELVVEVLEKETLQRRDLERIFSAVEKRPRITVFNEFGDRLPSDKPPIKTPRELAAERGDPWPEPEPPRQPEPAPVAAPAPQSPVVGEEPQSGELPQPGQPQGGAPQGGAPQGGPQDDQQAPGSYNPYAPPSGPNGTHGQNGGQNGGRQWPGPQQGGGQGQPGQPYGQQPGSRPAGPPNYGAPPGWTPATSPNPRPTRPWAQPNPNPQPQQRPQDEGGSDEQDGHHR
ncbi:MULTISPECIES: ATP-dependent zinc metalloprotease FtsH [Prauserella salsuginis group]|uniref:ATP-dependent zinc metalloprotease FtsH n=1 Tax=Prauserella salsuginis TaxID=387889 RepID=A0ABW6G702_9PSEU|nr:MULTISPECIES: ATP-dependent zinc metalloprotease FtsH [Prauserella salsuginis group]MCR3720859.1 cell division protease FtsH [Prauserella flava]MCR3735060.1 cell division protease FtsH [Prauserella salsuginis]